MAFSRFLSVNAHHLALALASGVLTNLAFAPLGIFPVVFVTLAILYWLWDKATPIAATSYGFAFGFGLFAVGVHWLYVSLHDFGNGSPAIAATAVILMSCFMGLLIAAGGFVVATIAVPKPVRFLVTMPALWVAIEWIRGWLLTGFPWLYIGYTQVDSYLIGWAPLLGVLGVSFAAAVIAGALALMFSNVVTKALPIAVITLVFASGLIAARIDWVSERLAPINVAVIQGDISVTDKWDAKKARKHLNYFVQESILLSEQDLIIWPEIALSHTSTRLEHLRLWEVLARIPADFLVGTLEERKQGNKTEFFNAAFGISPQGIQVYRKHRLVPFGEYTPLRSVTGWLENFVVIPSSDMTAYTARQFPLQLAGHPVGVSICYEDAFSEELRKMLPMATFLVNISEDAWFGRLLAPHQRLQMSRMRAAETARPVVRGANQGISATIDHRGSVINELSQADGKLFISSIVPTRGETMYVKFGSLPILTILAVLLAFAVLKSLHRRRGGESN